jgi:hypothetical protein
MLPVFALMAATAEPAAGDGWVALRPVTEVVRPGVRLGEIADLFGAPSSLRGALSTLEVAQVGPGVTDLDGVKLKAKLEALAPSLQGRVRAPAQVRIERPAIAAAAYGAKPSCGRLLTAHARGAAPSRAAFAPAACAADADPSPLRYDPSVRAVRFGRAAVAGEVMRLPDPDLFASTAAGEPLRVEVRYGPVSVDRRVTTLQPRRPGRPVAVRTEQGEVFTAPAEWIVDD